MSLSSVMIGDLPLWALITIVALGVLFIVTFIVMIVLALRGKKHNEGEKVYAPPAQPQYIVLPPVPAQPADNSEHTALGDEPIDVPLFDEPVDVPLYEESDDVAEVDLEEEVLEGIPVPDASEYTEPYVAPVQPKPEPYVAPVQPKPEPPTANLNMATATKLEIAPAPRKTLDEAYVELSAEFKAYFDKIITYALSKSGAKETKTNSNIKVKIKSDQIVKVFIKRKTPVASFLIENDMLKTYRKELTKNDGAKIAVKPIDVAMSDRETFEAAKGLVDMAFDQIEHERELKKEARRERRRQARMRSDAT